MVITRSNMWSLLLTGCVSLAHASPNWVSDPSFEELAEWNHPNPTNVSGWISSETGNTANWGWVSRELNIVKSGSQALRFTTWAGNASAFQNLGLTVDSDKTYEISFAMRLDNKSTNPAQTNETKIGVVISTSPTLGGTYSWSEKSIYDIAPSTTGVWETITLHIDGSDPLLAEEQGEFIQLSLKKFQNSKNSEYQIFIDDVSFKEFPAPDSVVSIDTTVPAHDISKMALGGGLVYSWYDDAMFADGKMAHIFKDIGVGGLRWPGGAVVTYYHWDDLNGQGWQDHWNPNYDRSDDLPPEMYQDLDEYLSLIDETGAEIMLGVNMSSGIEWDREPEAVAEASNLMVYVQSQGYDVKYVYFDNENFQDGNNYNRDDDNDGEAWTPELYAEKFNLYAAAVKATFPDAKLIANAHNNVNGSGFLSDMQIMLGIAGHNIDLVDVHYYWSWNTATWDIWKSQLPMMRGGGLSFKETVEYANNLFAAEGYPHVRLAILEWNIAPGPWETDPDHTKFKTALMQSEIQMQFLQAGLDVGMLWALDVPSVSPSSDRHALHNGDPNATALWMWMFSKAAGKTVVQSSSPTPGIYLLAAEGDDGELITWMLNKTDTDHTLELNLNGYAVSEISEAWKMIDAGDGQGSLEPLELWEVNGSNQSALPADSLSMVAFNYVSNALPEQPVIESVMAEPVPDGILLAWDGSSGTPNVAAAGVIGSLATGGLDKIDDTAGSTDGTYGGSFSGATMEASAFAVREADGKDRAAFTVKNKTGYPLRLDTMHFDYASWWANSPKDVELIYASGDLAGITNRTVIQSVVGLSNTGKKNDYPDFDWSLAGLSDRVLDHGQEVSFELVVSNAGASGSNGAFDNMAISGGTISNTAETIIVSWRAETGRKYTVMQSDNLLSNDWNSATESIIGKPGDLNLPVELEFPSFYRLNVE